MFLEGLIPARFSMANDWLRQGSGGEGNEVWNLAGERSK